MNTLRLDRTRLSAMLALFLAAAGVSALLASTFAEPAHAHRGYIKHGHDLVAFRGDHHTGTMWVCDREADGNYVIAVFYVEGDPKPQYAVDLNGSQPGCGGKSLRGRRILRHAICEVHRLERPRRVSCTPRWSIHRG